MEKNKNEWITFYTNQDEENVTLTIAKDYINL